MTTPTTPDPDAPDSGLRDTGGNLDAAHDDSDSGAGTSDGPDLSAAAEEHVSDDLGNLTGN